MNPVILTLLKALGLDANQLQQQGAQMVEFAQSIDARLNAILSMQQLLDKRLELLTAMLTSKPSGPPYPSEEVKRITN